MGTKEDPEHEERKSPLQEILARKTVKASDLLPMYYITKPSNQSPTNPDQDVNPDAKPVASKSTKPANKPPNAHRDSAPASTIHAVSPYVDLDAERRANRKNKSLGQRMKGFWERNFRGEEPDQDVPRGEQTSRFNSAPQLNVFGVGIKGGLVSPYEKKGKK